MRTPILAAVLVAGCTLTPAQQLTVDKVLASAPGALFCQFQKSGGGVILATVANGAVGVAAPGAAPLAVLATNMTVQFVNAACAEAARQAGAVSGVPISPPVAGTPVQVVPITPPAAAQALNGVEG